MVKLKFLKNCVFQLQDSFGYTTYVATLEMAVHCISLKVKRFIRNTFYASPYPLGEPVVPTVKRNSLQVI